MFDYYKTSEEVRKQLIENCKYKKEYTEEELKILYKDLFKCYRTKILPFKNKMMKKKEPTKKEQIRICEEVLKRNYEKMTKDEVFMLNDKIKTLYIILLQEQQGENERLRNLLNKYI